MIAQWNLFTWVLIVAILWGDVTVARAAGKPDKQDVVEKWIPRLLAMRLVFFGGMLIFDIVIRNWLGAGISAVFLLHTIWRTWKWWKRRGRKLLAKYGYKTEAIRARLIKLAGAQA